MDSDEPTDTQPARPSPPTPIADLMSGRPAATSCRQCPIGGMGICQAWLGSSPARIDSSMEYAFHEVRRRRAICRAGDSARHVIVICQGLAFRFTILADGRRQIMDFIFPGQLTSIGAPFREQHTSTVQALTAVRYAMFDREQIGRWLLGDAERMRQLARLCIGDMDRVEQFLADLGKRTAQERVARLILAIHDGYRRLGASARQPVPFPLRHEHIGDAVGLTNVHVGRVLRQMRSDGLLDIQDGWLSIPERTRLEQMAG